MRRLMILVLGCLFLAALAGCLESTTKLTPTKSGERTTTYGKALDAADRSACGTYVGQLNQAAMVYHQEHEAYPPDIATVIKESKLPASELANCHFTYDPASGKVSLVR